MIEILTFRWYADAFAFISDRRLDSIFKIRVEVIEDHEDKVDVMVHISNAVELSLLENHLLVYYKEQLGTYPENMDESEKQSADTELARIVQAFKQALEQKDALIRILSE